MADLTIDTTTFRAEVEGDAARPALMLSNSLGTDLSMWDGQMPELTKHFRVIRYDARGHGGSGGGDRPASIAQLGRDALAVLDALEIGKVHFVGLSMGGAVGLWLLANAPERIDRAVLANTAPKLGTPEAWNARITSVLGTGMEKTATATIERWFSADFITRESQQVEAIHDLLRNTSPGGYAACCAALRDMDLRESLSGIAHEVLVISGREDPVVASHDTKAMVKAIAGAQHVPLDGLHLTNIEAASEFTAAIVTFLTAMPTRARAKLGVAKPGVAKPGVAKPGAAKPGVVKPAARQRGTPPAKAAPRKASARHAAPAESAPSKRGSTTRRSNAARNPLKRTAVKAVAVKAAAVKVPAVTKATPAARTTKKKLAAARRRPIAKAAASRRTATKVAAKKRPAKSPRKTATARRPTPKTARTPVKVSPVKAPVEGSLIKGSPAKGSASKRPVAKVAAKKIKPRKTAVKVIKRSAAKAPAKKLPAARRKSVVKPRRPSGRRTP